MPRKNIKEFLGKPLLAWTIETALQSGVLDRLVLSTEDEEIAKVGRQYGAEVPFMRPVELAADTASSDATVKHAIEWLRDNEGYETEWVILFEPASPGRRVFHVQEVAKILEEKSGFDSLGGITEMPGDYSYATELQKDDNGIVSRVLDGYSLREIMGRTQDVPKSYFLNGQIYAFKSSNLLCENYSLWGNNTYGYLMDQKYAVDIDTPEDWFMAEIRMKKILEEEGL